MKSLAKPLTISQLNKIGDRFRKDEAQEDDLRRLDEYRMSFQPAYEHVFSALTQLGLNPGGRHPKTIPSIVAKLNREKSRLSKMQDIAGCRVEVPNRIEQDNLVDDLKSRFSGAQIKDRREKPSYGYRAVHVIVEVDSYPVEIQVRTALQHSWASTAEKLSDLIDPQIKYGGGPKEIWEDLTRISNSIVQVELAEIMFHFLHEIVDIVPKDKLDCATTRALEEMAAGRPDIPILKAISERGLANVVEEHESNFISIREGINTKLKDLLEAFKIIEQ